MAPFTNISSFRHYRFFKLTSNANSKQAAHKKIISDVYRAPDFLAADTDVNYDNIEKELAQSHFEWEDKGHGWKRGVVTLEIPLGKKQAPQNRRRTTVEDAADSDDEDQDQPQTRKFDVKGFHY